MCGSPTKESSNVLLPEQLHTAIPGAFRWGKLELLIAIRTSDSTNITNVIESWMNVLE